VITRRGDPQLLLFGPSSPAARIDHLKPFDVRTVRMTGQTNCLQRSTQATQGGSRRSQAAGGGLVGGRLNGGCAGSRNARFSCMAALRVWRRLGRSAQESVDDLAKLEQITEPAQRGYAVDIVIARRCAGIAPVGPRGRNERSASVRQDDEHEQHAASFDAADHRQRLALERVAFAQNSYLSRGIMEVGSLSMLPWTRSVRSG
jgi:hypothetical protein